MKRTALKKSSSSSSALKPLNEPCNKHPRTEGEKPRDITEKPRDITGGEKRYTLLDLVSRYIVSPEEELIKASRIPIELDAIVVEPDLLIRSIIDNSPTLRIPDIITSSGARRLELKGLAEFTAVVGDFYYGQASCRGPFVRMIIPETEPLKLKKFTNNGALFILLVPSTVVVHRFARAMVADRFKCIVVSAEGPPDILIRMAKELELPVLAFLDTDPRAFEILAFYGRKLNNIKWLGIRPMDTLHHLLASERLPPSIPVHLMTDDDAKTLQILKQDSYINSRPPWRNQLEIMLQMNHKIELEIVSCIGFLDYVTDLLLPMKLQDQDWI